MCIFSDSYKLYIYIGASLVAPMVKNLPSVQKTWVQSLGWEDSLEEAWQCIPVFLPRESPMERGAWWVQSIGLQRVGHD